MRLAKRFFWAAFFLLPPLLFNFNARAAVIDDYTPEVTARVVRISFLRGDVQIRRAGGDAQTWERATLNLPLVEGDELATDANGRVEIQLDSFNHIRLAENSYLKLTTLRDEGVAVSLPQGTMSVRLQNFVKEKSYFEIDAPETTVSIETAGLFRVDAGGAESEEVTLSAGENGEARVYTKTSGFTLRSGRAARIATAGRFAGDYETTAGARYADDFEAWVLERDALVAKRLKDAYYDKYYDRDMYGAEDLNEYGEWIQTRKYGWVWKPFPGATRQYANWSPYRYGHWRWVPVYGWTWVNDEPWGWATYHHGRWVWDDGHWLWTPYGYYRWRRSWWRPAMVRIVTWNGTTICWYPLSYGDTYYEYNSYHYRRNTRIYNNTTIINNNTTVVVNPTPNPSPTQPVVSQNPSNEERGRRVLTPTMQRNLPPGAVVAVDASEFGRETKGYRTLPPEVTRKVLTTDNGESPPILPSLPDLNGKVSKEILIENPRRSQVSVKTGATERKDEQPLDERLRQKRILGNRTPVESTETNPSSETKTVRRGISGRTIEEPTRKTGTVTRPVFRPEDRETKQPETRQGETPPIIENPNPYPSNAPRKTGGGDRDDERRKPPMTRPKQDDENQSPPIFVPPPRPPKEERREQPNYPPRQESPKQREEPPPPRREEPRPQPAPPKSEPPPERKSPPPSERKTDPGKTDNR